MSSNSAPGVHEAAGGGSVEHRTPDSGGPSFRNDAPMDRGERSTLQPVTAFTETAGVDISAEVWDGHRGLRIRYFEMAVGIGQVPEAGIDFVMNAAACHHVAGLDRALRMLCRSFSPGGSLVGFDDADAHSSQYTYLRSDAARESNRRRRAHLHLALDGAGPRCATRNNDQPRLALEARNEEAGPRPTASLPGPLIPRP